MRKTHNIQQLVFFLVLKIVLNIDEIYNKQSLLNMLVNVENYIIT